jgi:hypothetical protein
MAVNVESIVRTAKSALPARFSRSWSAVSSAGEEARGGRNEPGSVRRPTPLQDRERISSFFYATRGPVPFEAGSLETWFLEASTASVARLRGPNSHREGLPVVSPHRDLWPAFGPAIVPGLAVAQSPFEPLSRKDRSPWQVPRVACLWSVEVVASMPWRGNSPTTGRRSSSPRETRGPRRSARTCRCRREMFPG